VSAITCMDCRKPRVEGVPGPGDCLCGTRIAKNAVAMGVLEALDEILEAEAKADEQKRRRRARDDDGRGGGSTC
jgi:hypothetical protein